jgi:hypothetical protein
VNKSNSEHGFCFGLSGGSSAFLTDVLGFSGAPPVVPLSSPTPEGSTGFRFAPSDVVVGLSATPVMVVLHLRSVSPSPVSLLLDVVSTEPGGPGGSVGGLEGELLLSSRLDGGEGSSPLLAGGSSCVPGAPGMEQLVFKGEFGSGFGGSLFSGLFLFYKALISSLSGFHFSFSIVQGSEVDTFSSSMCSVSTRHSVSGSRNFSLGSPASVTIRASLSSRFSSGGSVGLSPPAIPVIIPPGLLSSTVGFLFLFCRIVLFFNIVESVICTDLFIIKPGVSCSILSVLFNGLLVYCSSLLSRGLSISFEFVGGSFFLTFHSGFMVSPLFLSVCSCLGFCGGSFSLAFFKNFSGILFGFQ